jgi:hypothetical protein
LLRDRATPSLGGQVLRVAAPDRGNGYATASAADTDLGSVAVADPAEVTRIRGQLAERGPHRLATVSSATTPVRYLSSNAELAGGRRVDRS